MILTVNKFETLYARIDLANTVNHPTLIECNFGMLLNPAYHTVTNDVNACGYYTFGVVFVMPSVHYLCVLSNFVHRCRCYQP